MENFAMTAESSSAVKRKKIIDVEYNLCGTNKEIKRRKAEVNFIPSFSEYNGGLGFQWKNEIGR